MPGACCPSRVRRASKYLHNPVTSFRQRNRVLDEHTRRPDVRPQPTFPPTQPYTQRKGQNAVLQDDVHRCTFPRIRVFSTRRFLLESMTGVTDDLIGKQKHIKDLVSQSAMHVLDNGGTVRGFRYWGTRTLPQRMKRHTQFFNYGECVPFFPHPRSLQGPARILALLPYPPIECAKNI